MLEEHIKEIVKKELAKQKLNGMYGKNKQELEQELKQENKKLRKELRDSKNGLNGANDTIKNMKQENEKLKIKVDEYYNKFLSEGIKKENTQQLIRKIEKQIDLQGIDQDDFYSPEQTFYRIKKILKES